MKVSEMIEALKKQNPDAEVQFFDYAADKILSLSEVDAGRVRGTDVVILGEVSMSIKKAAARITQSTKSGNLDESLKNIRDILGKASKSRV